MRPQFGIYFRRAWMCQRQSNPLLIGRLWKLAMDPLDDCERKNGRGQHARREQERSQPERISRPRASAIAIASCCATVAFGDSSLMRTMMSMARIAAPVACVSCSTCSTVCRRFAEDTIHQPIPMRMARTTRRSGRRFAVIAAALADGLTTVWPDSDADAGHAGRAVAAPASGTAARTAGLQRQGDATPRPRERVVLLAGRDSLGGRHEVGSYAARRRTREVSIATCSRF
jgi:hypothetical protein